MLHLIAPVPPTVTTTTHALPLPIPPKKVHYFAHFFFNFPHTHNALYGSITLNNASFCCTSVRLANRYVLYISWVWGRLLVSVWKGRCVCVCGCVLLTIIFIFLIYNFYLLGFPPTPCLFNVCYSTVLVVSLSLSLSPLSLRYSSLYKYNALWVCVCVWRGGGGMVSTANRPKTGATVNGGTFWWTLCRTKAHQFYVFFFNLCFCLLMSLLSSPFPSSSFRARCTFFGLGKKELNKSFFLVLTCFVYIFSHLCSLERTMGEFHWVLSPFPPWMCFFFFIFSLSLSLPLSLHY